MSSNQVVPLKSGARLAAIVPQTFEDVQRIAVMAVRAGLGPSAWNDNAEQSVAKATAAIMHGLELGLSPMQSLSGIAVINGKTTIYGDLLTAVLWSNGFKVKKWIEGEGDGMVARARITRPDGEVIMAMFAQRAIALDETDYAIRKLEMDCAEIVQFLVRNHKEPGNE